MIITFSAFFSSAALVKWKDPVITACPSIIMALLWAMPCAASIKVDFREFAKKVAEEYYATFRFLSRMAWTFTPRLWASRRDFAMDAKVKEYACTRIFVFEFLISATMVAVQPPLGLKKTLAGVLSRIKAAEHEAVEMIDRVRDKHNANAKRKVLDFMMKPA
jgi:hypothetical protein